MNKNLLITGAAKRLGREIALAMAYDGWNVAIHYNNSHEEAQITAEEIRKKGRKAITVKADLTNHEEVAKIFPLVNEQLGEISCLINNASMFKNDNIGNVTLENMQDNMATHLYAPVILSQQFAKQLQGEGNIINMLDYCVLNLPEKFISYAISKSALWTATQMLARQLAPKIRVNGIAPGHSMMNEKEATENFTKAYNATPVQKPTMPEEICNAVKFIISSPTMNGNIIPLDGGKHLIGANYYN